ncbi:SgrR family transcriptional regulator [Photobacterium sp. GJ3]|uniref:ABC transporter substrate-binding protein n=1 Tax=Photobacterium sp. GJ3 TaxID=2829502 RepID=UPI001B8B117B|nr:SgrR family transcriptional regulator [Photobacterium sp. GJ3]QUJ66164.1 SgrR family transcriptional regulator [Photobacterium sp. GJ3]
MNEAILRRLHQLLKQYSSQTVHQVQVEDLERVFSTSRRNTSTIMSRLSEIGWIDWSPSVGRSKTSQLLIRVSLLDAICLMIEPSIAKGKFDQFSKLLAQYGPTAVKAVTLVTEKQNAWNEAHHQLLITEYPWVDSLDPAETFRLAELQVVKSVYDTLLVQDREGKLLPGLAHDWEVAGREIRLWIRIDVMRHDGAVLSVADIAESLLRLVHLTGPVSSLFSQIDTVDQISSQCLSLMLKSPNPLFLHALAMPHAAIVMKQRMHFEDGRSAFVGTGPFEIESWDKDNLVLRRHSQYFGPSALLNRITLSCQGEAFSEFLSFNQAPGEKEVHTLQSFSYLSVRHRPDAGISPQNLALLMDYIVRQKPTFTAGQAVSSLSFTPVQDVPPSAPVRLSGQLILVEPRWTIPYLEQLAEWLHHTIRQTGITLEVIELTDISHPEKMKDCADMLFLEEVIEQPHDYGVYEWMLTASGLRFLYPDAASWQTHQAQVESAVSSDSPVTSLLAIEQSLLKSHHYLPLFAGKEVVMNTCQVRGIQVRKTGYSDFQKLWIDGE